MPESKLKLAKKTHKTDFGIYEDYSARIPDTKIEAPWGHYICYHDGTFSDITNKLMWIQAPWGMTYNGKKFKGEPVELNWDDATQLFGFGGAIPYTDGRLRKEDIEAYEDASYIRGSCEITFSGYRNWRLPTARELLTLFVTTALRDTRVKQLREQLFPDHSGNMFWSANDLAKDWAWLFDDRLSAKGGLSLCDYPKESEYPVLFVRNF